VAIIAVDIASSTVPGVPVRPAKRSGNAAIVSNIEQWIGISPTTTFAAFWKGVYPVQFQSTAQSQSKYFFRPLNAPSLSSTTS
jgi:hypothetical protein